MMRLTGFWGMLLLNLAGVLVSGCASDDLRSYAPVGMGEQTLKCLSDQLPCYFVGHNYFGVGLDTGTPEECDEYYQTCKSLIDEHLMLRPSDPGYRSMCALLNTYFRAWDRLVVIERLGFADHKCGFVVVGVRAGQVNAVTNMRQSGGDWWEVDFSPRLSPVDVGKLKSCLADLDRARKVLPQRLFWFANVDWPIYVLHDITSDGRSFSFAVCACSSRNEGPVPEPLLDFARAAELVNGVEPDVGVPERNPHAAGLRAAGRTYAHLLERVWESVLGTPDYAILARGPIFP